MSRADAVGIVGAGRFGTALAHLVGRGGRDVVLWTTTSEVADEINKQHTNNSRLPGATLPASVRATGDPADLAKSARFIVLAVAAYDVRARARLLGDHLTGGHIVVHAIGSLAEPDDLRVSSVLEEETPAIRIGVIAGPALAEDLVSGAVSSMVCASEFVEVTHEARRLLASPPALRLYQGADLIGVELSAALAGAYTVALGLADGLEVGVGTRATLLTRAVAEGGRILGCAGADPRTFTGLAGLGNLLVRASGSDPLGDNAPPAYRFGGALASGERPEGTLPVGARAALAALRLAERQGERAPVLAATASVITGEKTAAEAAAMAAGAVAWNE